MKIINRVLVTVLVLLVVAAVGQTATNVLSLVFGAARVVAQAPSRMFGTDPTTGAAVPVTATASILTPCDQSAVISGATAATAAIAAASTGKRVVVCGFTVTGGGATSFKLVYGTGATCGTGTADLTGAMELGDNTSIGFGDGLSTIRTPVSQALCWVNSAAVQISGVVSYGQY